MIHRDVVRTLLAAVLVMAMVSCESSPTTSADRPALPPGTRAETVFIVQEKLPAHATQLAMDVAKHASDRTFDTAGNTEWFDAVSGGNLSGVMRRLHTRVTILQADGSGYAIDIRNPTDPVLSGSASVEIEEFLCRAVVRLEERRGQGWRLIAAGHGQGLVNIETKVTVAALRELQASGSAARRSMAR
ncbi:MAG: hypothetical protein CMK32_02955 [Porticoccaceae bacterium]|nr:hypothetical protein [Porticoccaceae bacterium]|tara:strand:+ start:15548 stop:16111 length:564 start_codon:yes stop_codon:yes gene_type:complete